MMVDIFKQEIATRLIELKNSDSFRELNKFYSIKSELQIYRNSRDEDTHSDFLRWLLDNQENHNMGSFALKKLLDLVVFAKNSDRIKNAGMTFPDEIENWIISDNYDVDILKCEREKYAKNVGRPDLVVSFSIRKKYQEVELEYKEKFINIILENKVKSSETEERVEKGDSQNGDVIFQTVKYFDWGEKILKKELKEEIGKDFENIYVFLTPLSNYEYLRQEEQQCKSKKFVELNYQHLLEFCLEPFEKECAIPEYKAMVGSYLHALSHPSIAYTNNRDGKKSENAELIMAIGTKEKKLLESLLENKMHKESIGILLTNKIDNTKLTDQILKVLNEQYGISRYVLESGAEELLGEFWTSYNDLLTTLFKSRLELSDEQTDKHLIELYLDVTNTSTYSKRRKDMSKFKFNGKEYTKVPLILAVVKYVLDNNPGISLDDFEKKIPQIPQNEALNTSFWLTQDQINSLPQRSRQTKYDKHKFELSDAIIYVSSEIWAHREKFLPNISKDLHSLIEQV